VLTSAARICGRMDVPPAQHFMRDGNIVAFAVRRFVCPAILANYSGGAVRLPAVFRATMNAFTLLWHNYRFALKIELAVLFNTLIRLVMVTC